MTIGALARTVGVKTDTVRHYEKEGLLPAPERAESGYRRYGPEAEDRLRFVLRARELGFSLPAIRELLDLQARPGATAHEVRRRAMARLADLERRIADLERMRAALQALADTCTGDGPATECPILEALR